MLKHLSILLISVMLLSCSDKQKKMLTGSWIAPISGMEAFSEGFTLKENGSALSINSATLQYKKWRVQNDRLIVEGESIGNGQTITFTDTFTIVKTDTEKPTLRSKSGRELRFADPGRVADIEKEYKTDYCFSNKATGDIVEMKYRMAGNNVIGSLTYHIAGKDKNFGTIQGMLYADTLIGNYTFFSEGSESVRQIAFLKKGNGWIEGLGEVASSGNTVQFKEIKQLKFEGFLLEAAPCK